MLYPFVKKKGCNITMKKIKSAVFLVLCFAMLISVYACSDPIEGSWDTATYLEDKEFGEGAKTVVVEVKAGEKSVVFTIHTDKETLGEALIEHSLLEGEDGPYGLYVKKVNGITADADKDKTYWALYKDGEYSLTGVDMTPIADGERYELVREKF